LSQLLNGEATAMAIRKLAADFISLTAGTNEVIDEITALENGSFVVTSHRSASSGALKYFARVYDSTNALVSGPVALNNSAYATFSSAKLTKVLDAGDGTYLILWNAPPQTGSTVPTVMSQHFAADGSKIGTATEQTVFANQSKPLPEAIVATGDAATPFAWTAVKTAAGETHLTLTLLDANFTPQGNETVLSEALVSDARISGIERMSYGKLLVSFLENKSTAATDKLSIAILDIATGTFSAPIVVAEGTIYDSELDVNPVANGSFVVTTRMADATRPNGIKIVASTYDVNGNFLATANQITDPEPVYGKDFETVMFGNDRFATMWVTADHIDPKKTVLFLQYFDAEGLTISNEILLGYVPRQASGINLHAELNAAGNLVLNWIGLSGSAQVKKSAVFDPDKFVATSGYDWWTGTSANETFRGAAGDDELYGRDGTDKLYGDSGNDTLHGGYDGDVLDGGVGEDTVSYFYEAPVRVSLLDATVGTGAAEGDTFVSIERLVGSNKGNDRLLGNKINNIIWGYVGDDALFGGLGNDILVGGKGKDVLNGGSGVDRASYYEDSAVTVSLAGGIHTGAAAGDTFVSIENLQGSATGSDRLTGNEFDNEINGEGGNDVIYGAIGDDSIFGGTGADTLYGNDGADFLDGNSGNDKLYGGLNDDKLYGGTGADVLNGGGGYDFADYGGASRVTVSLAGRFANSGAATGDTFVSIEGVYGTHKGADRIGGNGVGNDLFGFAGNDKLYGEGGGDYLFGGAGADLLDGGAGIDWASYFYDGGVTVALDKSAVFKGTAVGDVLVSIENLGGSRNFADVLIGNEKDNYISGNGGNDTLKGRAGDDGIDGGPGKDILEGGTGKDYFVYSDLSDRGDKILDFEKTDYFSFYGSEFGFTGSGYLPTEYFAKGLNINSVPEKTDSSPLFYHRTTDDTLWFRNGGSAVLIADLNISFDLTANNIYIY
jgi:Ca2+-binding RTX toxin-like protein